MSSVQTNKQPMIDGLPEASEVHELMKSYETVNLRVQRRNDKGHLATVLSSQIIPTKDLLDFDSWVMAQAGGGDYVVYVRPPHDSAVQLLRFTCRVEGAPLPPQARLGRPVAGGEFGSSTGSGPQRDPASAWAEGIMDPEKRAAYLGQSPGTIPSDQLAMRELAETKAALAKIQERHEQERKEAERYRIEAEKRYEQQRLDAQEAKHKAELEMLRSTMSASQAETKAMLAALRETKPEPRDMSALIQGVAAVAAAIAPVLATFISSSRESSSKSLEVQQQGLATLMNAALAQANKPDPTMEMFKTIGPLIIPLVQNMMDQKSPSAQAALFSAVSENQLNSVAMMAQLIESFAGNDKEEPWWLPMMRETLAGAVSVGQAMMEGNRPQVGGGENAYAGQFAVPSDTFETASTYNEEPPRAPAPQPPQPAPQPQPQVVPQPQPKAKTNEAKTALGGLMQLLPAEFKTPEWRHLLTEMHDETADMGEVAELFAEHIIHCLRFDMLPEVFDGVLEDPERVLTSIMNVMPLMKRHPARAKGLIARVIETLTEMGVIGDEGDDEVIDTDGEDVSGGDEEAAE